MRTWRHTSTNSTSRSTTFNVYKFNTVSIIISASTCAIDMMKFRNKTTLKVNKQENQPDILTTTSKFKLRNFAPTIQGQWIYVRNKITFSFSSQTNSLTQWYTLLYPLLNDRQSEKLVRNQNPNLHCNLNFHSNRPNAMNLNVWTVIYSRIPQMSPLPFLPSQANLLISH